MPLMRVLVAWPPGIGRVCICSGLTRSLQCVDMPRAFPSGGSSM
jgi:hypothetical protein